MGKSFIKLLKSFKYAGQGFYFAFHTQRNMRIHLSFLVFMFFFLLKYDFFKISAAEFAVLVLTSALVFALELVNTAVECIVDFISPEKNRLAGIAKDVAAGAVLVAAIAAVIVGIIIMFQPEAFSKMGYYYAEHIGELVIVGVAVILAVIWVMYPRKDKHE